MNCAKCSKIKAFILYEQMVRNFKFLNIQQLLKCILKVLGEANSTLMGSQPSFIYVHTQSLLTCRMMGVVTYGLFMASIQCWNNYYYCYCYSRRYTMATWRWCNVLWLLLALSSMCRAREGEVQITSKLKFLFLDFVSQQI